MASDSKNKNWLGYGAYIVLSIVILLYFLFPADSVEEFLDNSVSSINSEFSFKAEKIRPWIPAGVRFSSGQIYLSDTSRVAVFESDNFFVAPDILKLVKGEYSFGLEGTAYKGDISGTINLTGEDRDIESEITFRDFVLEEYDLLAEKFKTRIIGNLSGQIAYSSKSLNKAGGSGSFDLRLSDGLLQFQAPVFNINSLDLQSIKLEAKLNRGEITIIKAELQGPEVNGSMTGSIHLQKDISQSKINLRGTLEPLAQFYQNYPEIRELLKTMNKRVKRGQYLFLVTGTLSNPEFKIL